MTDDNSLTEIDEVIEDSGLRDFYYSTKDLIRAYRIARPSDARPTLEILGPAFTDLGDDSNRHYHLRLFKCLSDERNFLIIKRLFESPVSRIDIMRQFDLSEDDFDERHVVWNRLGLIAAEGGKLMIHPLSCSISGLDFFLFGKAPSFAEADRDHPLSIPRLTLFTILADDLNFKILSRLALGSMTESQIVRDTGESEHIIQKRIVFLVKTGLIVSKKGKGPNVCLSDRATVFILLCCMDPVQGEDVESLFDSLYSACGDVIGTKS